MQQRLEVLQHHRDLKGLQLVLGKPESIQYAASQLGTANPMNIAADCARGLPQDHRSNKVT
jgi:hypothetical protein